MFSASNQRATSRVLGLGVSTLALIVASQASAQDSSPQAPAVKVGPNGGTVQPTAPVPNTQDGGISRSTSPSLSGAPAPDVAEGQQPSGQDPVAARAEAATDEDIVVTGIRASLANSQSIKRDSDTVVDAITAQDIGALPDRSVTEALQRVPGVTISRFAAAQDPDHFSSEGSGIVVRGLNYVRSEFNGRDTFSANGGRALSFQDVSPELLGSVEVFKNLTPDMIEGGIAGTVSLNTRKPFDTKDEQQFYLSADMNYADFAKRGSPAISGLYTRNFDTSIGRFGVLVGGSYSQLYSRADGIQIANYQQRFNGSRDSNGDGVAETDTFPGIAAGQAAFVPQGAGIRTQQFNRERIGAAAALQYQTNDESLLATFQFLRTDARQTWGERTFETTVDSDRSTFPAAGSSFVYDENNVFQSGIVRQAGGREITFANRGVKSKAKTDDFGGNIKWDATDRLSFNADGQYVRSTNDVVDFSVYGASFGDIAIDTTSKIPNIEFLAPGGGVGSGPAYFANPANVFYRAAMDHAEQSEGDEYAFRGDASYKFDDDSFLRAIKIGGRYANREQTVRYSTYNWAVLSEVWAGSGPVYANQAPAGTGSLFTFDNQFRGTGPETTNTIYLNGNPATNYADVATRAKSINALWVAKGGVPGWVPLGERAGAVQGTNFLPSEVYTNTEITKAAYARADFGGTLFGLNFSGNAGVRYVHTLDKADGFFTFPTRTQIISGGSVAAYCAQPNQTDSFCRLSTTEQNNILAFANGAALPLTNRNSFDHWLPSFNLKVGLTPKLITRFAYSKAISRPDFGQLQNTTSIAPAFGVTPYTLNGNTVNSNPNLKPVQVNQFDLTAEWYFARVGSLTAALFYKDLTDIIVNDVADVRPVTNNGITQNINFIGAQNAPGHGKIKGFELAYQQTYDFLPGLLSGFGVQANYTYVDPSAIPSFSGTATNTATTSVNLDDLPLVGLSRHTVNGTIFYEKGPISIRAAYNWRSRYLLTVRDVINPYQPIYSEAYGQLDGTILYSVNEHFKIGIQAVNLTDSTTKTRAVIDASGLTAPRSYFDADRRFSITTRMKF